jgi:hypothetical protein
MPDLPAFSGRVSDSGERLNQLLPAMRNRFGGHAEIAAAG